MHYSQKVVNGSRDRYRQSPSLAVGSMLNAAQAITCKAYLSRWIEEIVVLALLVCFDEFLFPVLK